MDELNKEVQRAELFNAIKESIKDARHVVRKLAQAFTDNVRTLRVEESESVFVNLIQNVRDLEYLLQFIDELKEGIRYFDDFGLPLDPISTENSGLNLFKEMNAAFETKDWIVLSDLVEYELSPLLLREDEWLGALDEKLAGYAVAAK